MLKTWIKDFDRTVNRWLPLSDAHIQKLTEWADLHRWVVTEPDAQKLLVRQALLNAIIHEANPKLASAFFLTPLDVLGVEAPDDLVAGLNGLTWRSGATPPWSMLYRTLIPQAHRRHLGQFWTDEVIADWMTAWLLQTKPRALLDVGCGPGTFLLQAEQKRSADDHQVKLIGFDISPLMLNLARANIGDDSKSSLHVHDYLKTSLPDADAIVCNPPYTRHHSIPPDTKDYLQSLLKKLLAQNVSRQGTLAFYFLLKLIGEMQEGSRAAVIVPMEVLDARYGKAARWALCHHTTITAMIHFSSEMNAFHKVDVGASILLFEKSKAQQNKVCHLTLHSSPATGAFLSCLDIATDPAIVSRYGVRTFQSQDELLEISKWFGVAKAAQTSPMKLSARYNGLVVPLKTVAKVMRGIATGANDFFALPTEQVNSHQLQPYVVRTLQRNRDIQDILLDETDWKTLSAQGKNVWLLYLNGNDVIQQENLRDYLSRGEAQNYHLRSLVQTRKRWYAMEHRDVPPLFFTILTRGNPRFILNRAGVRPLNMFSLIYPSQQVIAHGLVEVLWALLNASFSTSQLHSVSRTYGGNTLKVEPRELDNLPIINPMALPINAKQSIESLISDYFNHRDTPMFLKQVNGVIAHLLVNEQGDAIESAVPIQTRFIEPTEMYREPSTLESTPLPPPQSLP